jgi:superfamily I DNA/RNA helicase
LTSRTLLLGPPGCGKTTSLLQHLEEKLQQGVPPERMAYVSFTKAAVRDARGRAVERFGLEPSRFPYGARCTAFAFSNLACPVRMCSRAVIISNSPN